MNRPFLVLSFFLLGIATVSVNAQEYSSNSDSSHHPAPVYSKAEKKQMAKYRRVHGVVKDEHDNPVKSALVNLTNLTPRRP